VLALAVVTLGVVAGLVPLSALGGLAVLAGTLGSLEVHHVQQVRRPLGQPLA
jgi:hypothetical protein